MPDPRTAGRDVLMPALLEIVEAEGPILAGRADLVLGDDDGVLCVPFDQVEEVFKAATAKYDAEQKQIANIQAGTHDASWVDKQLREMKCEGVG